MFVYAMLFMSTTGALMAALKPTLTAVNVVAGALTFYMVVTAFLAVRRPPPPFQRLETLAALAAVAVSLTAFGLGAGAAGSATGSNEGDGGTYFMFGAVAFLAKPFGRREIAEAIDAGLHPR